MKYILIVLFGSQGPATLNVEFNDKASCLAAAAHITTTNSAPYVLTIMCAQKGKAQWK